MQIEHTKQPVLIRRGEITRRAVRPIGNVMCPCQVKIPQTATQIIISIDDSEQNHMADRVKFLTNQ